MIVPGENGLDVQGLDTPWVIGQLGCGEFRFGEDALEPDLAIGVAEPQPGHPQRTDEMQHGVGVALGPGPFQCGAEVLCIGERAPEELRPQRSAPPGLDTGDEGVAVSPPGGDLLVGLGQLFDAVLADGLQQAIAGRSALAVDNNE